MQVKTEFMQLWDGITATNNVIVVGATNRANRLNDAIWRRFSTQLEVRPSEPSPQGARPRRRCL